MRKSEGTEIAYQDATKGVGRNGKTKILMKTWLKHGSSKHPVMIQHMTELRTTDTFRSKEKWLPLESIKQKYGAAELKARVRGGSSLVRKSVGLNPSRVFLIGPTAMTSCIAVILALVAQQLPMFSMTFFTRSFMGRRVRRCQSFCNWSRTAMMQWASGKAKFQSCRYRIFVILMVHTRTTLICFTAQWKQNRLPTANLLPVCKRLCQKYLDGSDDATWRLKCLTHLCKLQQIHSEAGLFLTDEQVALYQNSATKFLQYYNMLSKYSYVLQDRIGQWLGHLWTALIFGRLSKGPAKALHFIRGNGVCFTFANFWHGTEVSMAANSQNALLVSHIRWCSMAQSSSILCYAGEDLVGNRTRLAEACLSGLPPHMVPSTVANKYQLCLQASWSEKKKSQIMCWDLSM